MKIQIRLLALIMVLPPAEFAYLDRLAVRWREEAQRRYWAPLPGIETGIFPFTIRF
jgi:hypothetical protein